MAKKDKLAALRAARAAGTSRHVNLSDESDKEDDLFDIVSEDEFRERKRQQFLQDDFVEDDNGEGYVDDGTDDFGIDGKHSYYHTEEEIREKRKKIDKKEQQAKKKQKIAAANAAASASEIDSFFTKTVSAGLINNSSKKKASADVDFSDLFQELPSSKKKPTQKHTSALTTPKAPGSFNIFNSSHSKNHAAATPLFQTTGSKFGGTPSSTGTAYFTAPSSRKPNSFLNQSALKNVSQQKKKIDFGEDDDGFDTAAETSFDFMGSSPTKAKAESKIGFSEESSGAAYSATATDTAETTPVAEDSQDKKKENAHQEDSEEEESEDEEDVMIVKRQRVALNSVKRDINISSTSKKLESHIKQHELEDGDSSNREADQFLPNSSSPEKSYASPSGKHLDISTVVDSEGKFRMFWTDYAELDNTLLLYGKTKTKGGSYVSTMVQVKNFHRQLHFLPRPLRLVDGEETEEKCTPQDIQEEIVPLLMEKFGLETIRSKPSTKKYCFELPNIPKESEYLTVLLPYNPPKSSKVTLPADLEGETFSHVFGTNSSVFETFVLDRNIMGPCWLEISQGDFTSVANSSHCKFEVCLENPKFITPIDQSTKDFKITPPPLTCCSLASTIVLNQKENKQEIVAVTLATYKGVPQDSPIPEDLKPTELVTLCRAVNGSSIPAGFQQLAEKNKLQIRQFANEKMLLSCLAGIVKNLDPDVFIGHRLESVSLDILMHRMFDLKIPTFSTMGRRQRRQWPDKFGKGSNAYNSGFLIRDIFSGRLLCDISNELGQSLTPKCQSWELAEMYDVVCKKQFQPLEINLNNPANSDNVQTFFMIVKENCQTALITAEISFRIQILSLSKQLTNLAGNGWCHTLSGTRAGRNEYILLHEFNKNGFILPDKETKASRLQQQQHLQQLQQQQQQQQGLAEDEDGDAATLSGSSNTAGKGKSKFQGGLVFDPERGLHKNYILVMDFNSLYPSIIQEFNICFTSVERNPMNQDQLPEVPSASISQGVLPKLLSNLVNRRREVKKLLKSSTSPVERAQYDIKQQALKLTANSMYGCLGFVNSRFYAKPLAMLVTNKGREILMDTRQLAESLQLKVVYGDTDSVMIDTGCMDFKEAIKIGENFKKLVNERYRLLEIDIDNVFKKLLLHAKKKYAALNVSVDKQGHESSTLEVKGLDMRRREYCPLSKEVSTYVLEQIMSDKDSDEALKDVYSYLESIAQQMEQDKIRHDKFKINTKLSKDPSAYPGGKSMPAVQVAFRLREQGKIIKAGSVITYVVCTGEADKSVAERSRSITEVLAKNSDLKPDPAFYLEKQLFAPVERLLEKIDDIDLVRLAECLGIKNYRMKSAGSSSSQSSSIDALQPLESMISDAERFQNTAPLKFNCSCGVEFIYGGIVSSKDYIITYSGLQCLKCSHTMSLISMTAQLENRIRSYISLYYQGFVSCDDRTCGMLTKNISVYGKRCLAPGCKGIMSYRYNDKELYNQLLYFEHLFNCERNKSGKLKPLYEEDDKTQPEKLDEGQVKALTEQNREKLETCGKVVEKYLNNNGRKYVDMGDLFSFTKIVQS
ncbi:hypothetical protein WICPIJ_001934 [Wickerhamomyces pijperi]|uniref:DNA polymerase n=1 Tax=Wickerhamomyces pijperi TaxID=599730 RepID=A0A9P8QCN2_WICPI|nr:hypothetical protein WICPIJ_001934 [Wickerhamomyces pijperi]